VAYATRIEADMIVSFQHTIHAYGRMVHHFTSTKS